MAGAGADNEFAKDGGASETTPGRTSSPPERGWALVAGAFFGVLGLAIFLFVHHRAQRAAELEAQLAQEASRLGREVEVKYRNYRTLVDNVTRIFTSAESALAGERDRTLNAAADSRREAKQREDRARARLADAKVRGQAAAQRKKDAESQHARTQAEEQTSATVYEAILAESERANERVNETSRRVDEFARALEHAETLVDLARRKADAARRAVDEQPEPPPLTTSSPDGSQLRLALAKAQHEVAEVQTKLEQAQLQLERANKDADAAWQRASDVYASARIQWERLAADGAKNALFEQFAAYAARELKDATDRERQGTADLASKQRDTGKRVAEVTAATTPNPGAEAALFVADLGPLVLPSQRADIEACGLQPNVKEAKLCVARAMAVLNQVRGLNIVECPAASATPLLSDDGRELLLPPTQAANSLPVCGRVKLRLLVTADPTPPPAEIALAPSAAGTARRSVQSAASRRSFIDMASSSADRRGPFDALFLLRADGTTLYSLDLDPSLRVSAFPGLDTKHTLTSTMLRDVSLGTGKYRVFVQPVRVPLASAGKATATADVNDSRERADLVIAGVVREDRLERASIEMSLPSYVWVVLALGFGLLSLPLAKLWLLGPKTSFRNFDVTLLATSALLLTLLSSGVVLALLAHNRLAKRTDRQLETVADELQRRLSRQLSASAKMLDTFDKTPSIKALSAILKPPSSGSAAQSLRCNQAGGQLVGSVVIDDPEHGRSVCERSRYSPPSAPAEWRMFFELDAAGNQRVKFLSGAHGSTPVNLRKRAYFSEALSGRTACLDETCAVRGVPELVRSVTSGELVLVVAQPICEGGAECGVDDAAVGVGAVEAPLEAFRQLVLPLGVQAAVIDANGQIMLHSNNDAHHEQSLFGEVTDPDELRAALAVRSPETVDVNYLGEASRVHLEPLRLTGTGWTVVTIAPTSLVDTATMDIVIATLFSYGFVLVLALLVTCGVLLRGRIAGWLHGDIGGPGPRHEAWSLRPRSAFSFAYARAGGRMIISGAALIAASLLGAHLLPTTLTLLAALGLCVLAAKSIPGRTHGPALARPVLPPRIHVASWRDFLPLTYLLYCAGLAETFVMTPTAVLFAGSYDHVVDTLLRAEQAHYGRALEHRLGCLDVLPITAVGGDKKGCSDVIGSGFERAPQAAEQAADPSILRAGVLMPIPVLADFLPRLGPSNMEPSGRNYREETRARPAPAPERYGSIREPNELCLVSTLPSGAKSRGKTLLVTPFPALVGRDYHWFALAALLLAAAAALVGSYTLGFHSLRRLLFLDVLMRWNQRAASSVEDFLVACSNGFSGRTHKFLVEHPSDRVRARLCEYPGYRELTSGSDERPPLSRALPPRLEPSRTLWVVDDLETFVATPDATERLHEAALLEGTVALIATSPVANIGAVAGHKELARALEPFAAIELTDCDSLPAPAAVCPPSAATLARWWLECDEEERSVLAQLALGGYATPHPANIPALKRLASRGLLDPESMTIAHEALVEHVRRSVTAVQRRSWAEEDRNTAWTALRIPLTTGVAALLAAVTFSKPELGFASALAPTLAASLPTVLKIMAQLVTPKAGG